MCKNKFNKFKNKTNTKEVITEDNYKRIVIKRMIICCWVLLAMCFIIKIFGYDIFNIICEDETFLSICNFIDSSVIYYISAFIQFVGSTLLMYLSISDKRVPYFILSIIVVWAYKLLVEFNVITMNMIVYLVLDYAILFLLLYLFSRKLKLSLLATLLNIVFVVISAIVKNLGLNGFIISSYSINLIYSIDYYIMIVLYFLYSKSLKNKKEI